MKSPIFGAAFFGHYNRFNNDGVDVIYTDFSKAFDKVETGVLLHKIRECKVAGKVDKWFAFFWMDNFASKLLW